MLGRRAKVSEIAATAGVSTATVDRVINARGGVRPTTVAKVERALQTITQGPPRGVGSTLRTFDIFLPHETARAMKVLKEELESAAARRNARVRVTFVARYNANAIVRHLTKALAAGSDGIALQVMDHPLVREELSRLSEADIPVVTLCTDLPGNNRLSFVGLDNRAAGRASGWLMGRLCRTPGKVIVAWGGALYRSHEERESGFRAILRSDFPGLDIVEEIDGNDDDDVSFDRFTAALKRHPDVHGIYCVGGGQRGVAEACQSAGLAEQIVMIGHNCNAETRPYLLSGTIDAVIHQDMERIAEAALKRLENPGVAKGDAIIPIEIVTRENLRYR
ncbi:MAG: LacI family DNA-binding transcriptional regulator [Hyphomicrobiaceae bacterium]